MPAIPIIVGDVDATAGSGASLAQYRNRLADEIGSWMETSVTTTASHGEASRVVLASEIRDDEGGYEFLNNDGRLGTWLYVRTGTQAGVQRRVISQPGSGYLGNLGALTLSRPFAAPLAAGDVVQVSTPLPIRRHLGIKGIDDLVDEALARIWVEARLPITGTGSHEYDLAAYPWLSYGQDQIRMLSDTRGLGSGTPALRSAGLWRVQTSGVDRTLVTETRYGTADTFYLDVLVRADRLVYDGASWTYVSTPGLQGDAWQGAAPESWVVAFGMVKALQYLERLTDGDERLSDDVRRRTTARLAERKQVWARAARLIQESEFPRMPSQQARAVTSVWETAVAW